MVQASNVVLLRTNGPIFDSQEGSGKGIPIGVHQPRFGLERAVDNRDVLRLNTVARIDSYGQYNVANVS